MKFIVQCIKFLWKFKTKANWITRKKKSRIFINLIRPQTTPSSTHIFVINATTPLSQHKYSCHLKFKWACKIVWSQTSPSFHAYKLLFSLEMTRMIIDSNSNKENHLLDDASCQYWAIIFTIITSWTSLHLVEWTS